MPKKKNNSILKGMGIRLNIGQPGTREYQANYMRVYRYNQQVRSMQELLNFCRRQGFIKNVNQRRR